MTLNGRPDQVRRLMTSRAAVRNRSRSWPISIRSPIGASLPLGRESRALRFEPFQGLSGLNAGGSSGAGIAGAVEVYEGAAGPAEVDGRVDGAAVCAP